MAPDLERDEASDATQAQRHAEDQSFADPVHKGGSPRTATDAVPSGGIRTQQTGSEEGAATSEEEE